MTTAISMDELIAFIREHQGISPKQEITESSLLENNLGITGDDGCELIQAIERQFGILFSRSGGSLGEAFDLSEGECLFHSEGTNLFWLTHRLFGRDQENVKAITVGDLHLAVCRAMEKRIT